MSWEREKERECIISGYDYFIYGWWWWRERVLIFPYTYIDDDVDNMMSMCFSLSLSLSLSLSIVLLIISRALARAAYTIEMMGFSPLLFRLHFYFFSLSVMLWAKESEWLRLCAALIAIIYACWGETKRKRVRERSIVYLWWWSSCFI